MAWQQTCYYVSHQHCSGKLDPSGCSAQGIHWTTAVYDAEAAEGQLGQALHWSAVWSGCTLVWSTSGEAAHGDEGQGLQSHTKIRKCPECIVLRHPKDPCTLMKWLDSRDQTRSVFCELSLDTTNSETTLWTRQHQHCCNWCCYCCWPKRNYFVIDWMQMWSGSSTTVDRLTYASHRVFPPLYCYEIGIREPNSFFT